MRVHSLLTIQDKYTPWKYLGDMDKNGKAMEELVCELRLFLDLLDREYLSSGVREKKMLISNILHRVLNANEPSFKSEIHSSLPAPPQMPLPEIPQPWLPPDNGPPPLPSSSLPEGYYEEAVPLSPGKAPEYITSNYDSDQMSSSYESYDEEEEDGKGRGKKMRHQWPSEEASMDLVKDARICAFLLRKKRFGQWTKLLCVIKDNKLLCYKSSKDQTPQMELVLSGCSITHVPKDGKKKKHELKIVHQGADALVLAVQSKEQAEEWLKVMREVCSNGGDSDGAGAGSPVHKPDLEKKVSCDRPSSDGEPPHENGHTVTDCKDQGKGKKDSQKSQKGGTLGKGAGKKITKIIGLGKKKPSTDEQTSSAEEDIPTCGYLNVMSNNRWRDRWCRLKDNQLLLHKDRADLKTHMASLPLRGCEVSPGLDSKHPFAFRLLRNGQEVAVLEASSSESMGRWLGVLLAETGSTTDPAALHYDYIDVETTANVIQLAKQSFCFTSKRVVSPNPYLDNPVNGYACPSGMALHYDDVPINGTDPEVLYSSPATGGRRLREEVLYENADLYENMPSPKLAARYSPKPSRLASSSSHYKTPGPVKSKFLSSSSSANTNTKAGTQLKGKKAPVTNGTASKQKVDKNQAKKTNGTTSGASVKRNNSSAEQYKYGKNRVEADAKRLQAKEEELMKRKQDIRNRLTQLKKDRKDLRTAMEASTGKRSAASLVERLKKVEDECKLKEDERVSLELELTEVKESLKKALSGGVTLGLTIEPKSGTSSPQSPVLLRRTLENSPISSCDTSDTESCSTLPVNSASLLRRTANQKPSTVRGHVLRKAKEWEMKTGT
ncbi:actin filament-associated protein 1 isoform X1 [Salmo salar]|uniref:Actin filament-associated protein 1 isoform X1 n=1 Tax=Salmo salar TaxID=8030 RepID=A0ABM3DEI6_SALSA|nr:actin filament-associated protein 1-like isoform X1 [Salmo salar]|eukprot:XP_014011009.1 PREDICTED: actin filament-associated protein 1-like isoform X1 [Salmo salar]